MIRARAPVLRHLLTWLSLVALAVLSLLLSRAHLGGASLAVALLIAAAQATIAAVLFMNIGEGRFSVALVPFAVIFFMALLIGLVALDVATRTTFPRAPAPAIEDADG